MARGHIPISRIVDGAGYESGHSGPISPWMQALVDRTPNAADAARKRQQQASVISQVNSIIANPPRYATVDDAVKDMRERTGLNRYLSTKQADIKKKSAREIVREIQSDTNVQPPEIQSDINVQPPNVLMKYKGAVDSIINFVGNIVHNSRGEGVSVPQLLYDISAIFGRRFGIRSEDFNNSEVIEFVSRILAEEKSKYGSQPIDNNINIGLGIGTDSGDDDANQDYFGFATPASR